jgi:hypothetical protein
MPENTNDPTKGTPVGEDHQLEPLSELTERMGKLSGLLVEKYFPDGVDDEMRELTGDAVRDLRDHLPGVSTETALRVAAYITDLFGGLLKDGAFDPDGTIESSLTGFAVMANELAKDVA